MIELDTFPATTANQITEEYYFFLIGQINAGTTTKKVQRVLHHNGSEAYFTYHLVTN
jgi:hypothetical protein